MVEEMEMVQLKLFTKGQESGHSVSSLKWEKLEHIRILKAMILRKEKERNSKTDM